MNANPKNTESNTMNVLNIVLSIYVIFKFLTMIFAGYLSWECGYQNMRPIQIFKTIVACIFSEFYLIYFFINTVMFGNQC